MASVTVAGSVPGPLQNVIAEAADVSGRVAVAIRTAVDEITIGVGELEGPPWDAVQVGVEGQASDLLGLRWHGGCIEGVRTTARRSYSQCDRMEAFRQCAGSDLEVRTLPAHLCAIDAARPVAARRKDDETSWSIVYVVYPLSGDEHLMTVDEEGVQAVVDSPHIADWNDLDLSDFGLTSRPSDRLAGRLDREFTLATAPRLFESLGGPPYDIVHWYRAYEGGAYSRRYVWRDREWSVQSIEGCELSVRLETSSGELWVRGAGTCEATDRVVAADVQYCADLPAPFVARRTDGGYWLIDRGGCVVELGPNLEPLSRRSRLRTVLSAPSAAWAWTLSMGWLLISGPFLQSIGFLVGRRRGGGNESAVRGAAYASALYLIVAVALIATALLGAP